jgi:hypothetical protein
MNDKKNSPIKKRLPKRSVNGSLEKMEVLL